jgi:Uma2 family endonuclease
MSVQTSRRLFTAEEYHRMAAAGILCEDDRVELLQGEIVEMSPIGSRHVACVNRLTQRFSALLGQRAIVSVQNPVLLGEFSEPEPDLTLLRWRDDFYGDALPRAEEVLLLVEVAQSSAETDREVKMALYAQGRVAEVWLVDLEAGLIEVYRVPEGGSYKKVQQFRRGQLVAAEAFPEAVLAVESIVG